MAMLTIIGCGYGVSGFKLIVEYDLATGTCVRLVPLTTSLSASWEGESDDQSVS